MNWRQQHLRMRVHSPCPSRDGASHNNHCHFPRCALSVEGRSERAQVPLKQGAGGRGRE